MQTKQLPRPLRRRVSDLGASLPIPFVLTCAGRELPWPGTVQTRQKPSAAAPPVCEECGKLTNGHARWCGHCDPLAD